MLHFEKPTHLIVNDLVIIYNIFCTSETIYVISNNYLTEDKKRLLHLEFKINDVSIQNINLFDTYCFHESVNLYKLENNYTDSEKKLTVCYNDNEYDIYLTKQHYIYEKNDFITLMTLFKYDYQLIPTYICHYKKLGVKHFYFYYNYSYQEFIQLKNIQEIIDNINNDPDIHCTFIEWDYEYLRHINGNLIHYAQCPAMTDMYYKSKHMFQYIFFNDLDEYLFFQDKEINNFNELINKYNSVNVFQFNMYWAKYINNSVMECDYEGNTGISYLNFQKTFNINHFVITEQKDKEDKHIRSKILLKTNLYGCTIHKPLSEISSNTEIIKIDYNSIILDGFYHITNLLEKKRNFY
jgi:hypothetical protein